VLVYRWEAELQAARRQATDPTFQASYRRWRPMVERSIAWLVAGGNRRVRYRGVARKSCGCPTESRPSTCAGWSPSA
jgi:Transposase DDE domain